MAAMAEAAPTAAAASEAVSVGSAEEWVEDSAGVVQVEVGRMVQKHVRCSSTDNEMPTINYGR